MCGRYSLALRPSQVQAYLENMNMPVYNAPQDDADDAPRYSYNFAPGYNGIVYRADTPHWGSGSRSQKKDEKENEDQPAEVQQQEEEEQQERDIRYKLQSMKWGLIPFWTKRNPDYGSLMRTINCRDDSLIENRGMWTTMKAKKRCVVIAQGFYEWLQKGKEKVPHYVKQRDGQLMCFAGLWDCVQYEGCDEKLFTYTVITTSSNKQLNFLHDRMPVILEGGSEEIRTWLDPKRSTWSKELQTLLKPFEGELEIYPVNKEVGKVGNNSSSFIIPVASSENKSNIANFFAKGATKYEPKSGTAKTGSTDLSEDSVGNASPTIKKYESQSTPINHQAADDRESLNHDSTKDNASLPCPEEEVKQEIKRGLDDVHIKESPPRKMAKMDTSPSKAESPLKPPRKTISATSNNNASPSKSAKKGKGSLKITNFFGK